MVDTSTERDQTTDTRPVNLSTRCLLLPTGAAGVTVFFLAMFGFFYVSMQYIQLVMGYDAIRTAIALTPLTGPMLVLSALSFWYVPRVGLRLVVFIGLGLVSVGYLCLRVLEIGSPYWHLAWPLLILSTGIGFCTAPTASAIMTSVPEAKQGVASAINDTTREIGAALGIALTGTMLATKYTAVLAPQLSAFPAEVRDAADAVIGRSGGARRSARSAGRRSARPCQGCVSACNGDLGADPRDSGRRRRGAHRHLGAGTRRTSTRGDTRADRPAHNTKSAAR